MSETVEVPFEGKSQDKAVLLLAAAEELGLDQSVVTVGNGAFLAPKEVADKAMKGYDPDKPVEHPVAEDAEVPSEADPQGVTQDPRVDPEPGEQKSSRRAKTAEKKAAKKTTAKKSTSKKAQE